MKRAKYIVFEGTEGTGKTTQTQRLADHLRSLGYRVLQTKEPGTSHSPLTMTLRGIMLDAQYENQLTPPARELISQAIRSIHLEKVVYPAFDSCDYIIQDRGLLSGYSYGEACGNLLGDLAAISNYVGAHPGLYNQVIYLKGNIKEGLNRALSSKQEFAAGDAIEARGHTFLERVSYNMDRLSKDFNTASIDVSGKSVEQVFAEILSKLNIDGATL